MYLSSDIRAKAFCPNIGLQIGVSGRLCGQNQMVLNQLVSGFRSLKGMRTEKALAKRRQTESSVIRYAILPSCAGTYQPFRPGFSESDSYLRLYFICLHQQQFSRCGPRMLATPRPFPRDPPGKAKTLHDHTKALFTLYPLSFPLESTNDEF